MLSCTDPCASRGGAEPCYCARINAQRRACGIGAGAPRGILSLEPGTPEHAARVAQRSWPDAERDGL